MIVNHLELFSAIFGANFVFKLLPNFALKITPKLGFWVKIDFYFIIQNLARIGLWSEKQNFRGLNSKQFLFLGHFQKMSFSCSKWYLKTGI